MSFPARGPTREAAATSVGLLLGGTAFFLALLNYRIDPLRTAVAQRYASNFFDLQATALLEGRLDLPPGALGIEGFVIGGKTYMYFPPFPALLRIPVQLVTHEFDGRLSLISMALAWVVFAAFTSRLLWFVRSLVRGPIPLSRFEAVAAALVLGLATGGTTLTFDAALPWVYHEVYLWSAALVVGGCYTMLRVVQSPDRSSVVRLAALILAAGLTRTPGGWALAVVTLLLGVFLVLRRGWRPGLQVFAAGAAPLAVAITWNAVKFGHPYLFPFHAQVWTQVNAHRREALRVNGGTITGPQFFETSLVNYFRPDGVRFVDYFPFITLPARPAPAYGGAFLDQTYRTGSVTGLMPGLLLLTLVGATALLLPRRSGGLVSIRWPMSAAVGAAVGVMGYGYLANRYTSDFVPALVLGAALGLWVAVGLVPTGWFARIAVLALLALLAGFSIAAQLATGSLVAAQTWGGDHLSGYLSLQQRLSGGPDSPAARLVTRSAVLPAEGRTDEIRIIGNCAAVYQNTGDRYEPWTLVQQRDMIVTVVPVFEEYRPGILALMRQTGIADRAVGLEFDRQLPEARLVIEDRRGNLYSPWFEVSRRRPITITAHALAERGLVRIRVGTTNEYDLVLATSEWNEDWYKVQSALTFTADAEPRVLRHAVVSHRWGPVPELCARLQYQLVSH